MADPATIRTLAEVPHLRDTLIAWYIAEWEPWYGDAGQGDAAGDIDACLVSGSTLPQCLIADDSQGDLVGTVTLRTDSVGSDEFPGPWIAALLVDLSHRGRGIGSALVAAAEAEALRLGFSSLSVSTDTAIGLLERRGWCRVGASTSLRGAVAVFSKSL